MEKPQVIAASAYKSAKWDELTRGREFRDADAPVLALLCQWYEVVDKCMADIAAGDGIEVAFTNSYGDVKALPQLSTMKQASAEIRALNKQLGINDEAAQPAAEHKAVPLNVIRANRQSKAASAG